MESVDLDGQAWRWSVSIHSSLLQLEMSEVSGVTFLYKHHRISSDVDHKRSRCIVHHASHIMPLGKKSGQFVIEMKVLVLSD